MNEEFPSPSLGGSRFSFLLTGVGMFLLILVVSNNSTTMAITGESHLDIWLTRGGFGLIGSGIVVGFIDWRLNRKHKKAKIDDLENEPQGDQALDTDEDMDRDDLEYNDQDEESEEGVTTYAS